MTHFEAAPARKDLFWKAEALVAIVHTWSNVAAHPRAPRPGDAQYVFLLAVLTFLMAADKGRTHTRSQTHYPDGGVCAT